MPNYNNNVKSCKEMYATMMNIKLNYIYICAYIKIWSYIIINLGEIYLVYWSNGRSCPEKKRNIWWRIIWSKLATQNMFEYKTKIQLIWIDTYY